MILTLFVATACSGEAQQNPDSTPGGSVSGENDSNDVIMLAYNEATSLGFDGSLDEFLALVKGADGKDGRSVEDISIYNGDLLVYLSDKTTINLGPINGKDGADGADGEDGKTPFIGSNGNWWIGDTDTGVPATGNDGKDGVDGAPGKDGADGKDGAPGKDGTDGKDGADGKDGVDGTDGKNGTNGKDGKTPFIGSNGHWWIGTKDTGVPATGDDGKDGENGKNGEDGKTPFIGSNGNWWIGTKDTGVPATGDDGKDGEDGKTPFIGSNGNWWIGTSDTGVPATGDDGKNGVDGAPGKDGVGISNIEIDSNGNLLISMTNGDVKNLGPVNQSNNALIGISLQSVEIADDGELIVTLTNGIKLICESTPLTTGNQLIKKLTVDEQGVVTATLQNSATTTVGIIDTVRINAEQEIVVVFKSGAEQTLGTFVSIQGAQCDHKFSDWVKGEEATCSSMGYDSRYCIYCHDLDYQFHPAKGHYWSGDAYLFTAPTKSQNGAAVIACDDCYMTMLEVLTPDGDYDDDGIKNGDETELFKTNPVLADTDADGLDDYAEVYTYSTNPTNPDTDADGALDGAEVKFGTDPLVAATNGSFAVNVTIDNGETTKPGISGDFTPTQLNSLEIEKNDFFEQESAGVLGSAYNYEVEDTVTQMTVSFSFDTPQTYSLRSVTNPTIYQFDEENNILTPKPTTVTNNKAEAIVDGSGTYILLDRNLYEAELKWIDDWGGIPGGEYAKLEIVFVVDDSGSMSSNDSSYRRLTIVQEIIDTFGENASAGIVKFSDYSKIEKLSGSTLVQCDAAGKALLKDKMTRTYFKSNGLTYLYSAINTATELFSSADDSTVLKIMIVLSDGYPEGETTSQATAISSANAKGIKVHTVGLGSNTSRFEQHLLPVSQQTGGEYQHSNDISGLKTLYDNIRMQTDLEMDSDSDGLCDYYEDNAVRFDSLSYLSTDKTNPDTDGDGLLDGEEVIVVKVEDPENGLMSFMGKVLSDPTLEDSDGDGYNDDVDKYPLNPRRK